MDDTGCLGCAGFILGCFILWALLFGVNVNGKHYEASCGCNGVNVEIE